LGRTLAAAGPSGVRRRLFLCAAPPGQSNA